jgi:hypothetical protein
MGASAQTAHASSAVISQSNNETDVGNGPVDNALVSEDLETFFSAQLEVDCETRHKFYST